MLTRHTSLGANLSNNELFLPQYLDYESFFHVTFPVRVNSENYLGNEGIRQYSDQSLKKILIFFFITVCFFVFLDVPYELKKLKLLKT